MYLIIGATGTIGSEVVNHLLSTGEPVRIFTRNADNAKQWTDRVQVAVGNLENPVSIKEALKGVDAVFFVSAAPDQDPKIQRAKNLVEAAKAESQPESQPYIVLLSSFAVTRPPLIQAAKPHLAREELLKESGLPWTIIRPTAFMSNTLQWQEQIQGNGMVFNPFADGKMNSIAPSDVGAVGAEVLTSRKYVGQTLDITGPELLTAQEQVAIISKVINKPIRCLDSSIEALKAYLAKQGTPERFIEIRVEAIQRIRAGDTANETETVEQVLGRPPIHFETWVQQNWPMLSPVS